MAQTQEHVINVEETRRAPNGATLTPVNNDPGYKGLYVVKDTFEEFFENKSNGNGSGKDGVAERRG